MCVCVCLCVCVCVCVRSECCELVGLLLSHLEQFGCWVKLTGIIEVNRHHQPRKLLCCLMWLVFDSSCWLVVDGIVQMFDLFVDGLICLDDYSLRSSGPLIYSDHWCLICPDDCSLSHLARWFIQIIDVWFVWMTDWFGSLMFDLSGWLIDLDHWCLICLDVDWFRSLMFYLSGWLQWVAHQLRQGREHLR